MTDRAGTRELKACCATFYQHDIVRLLLGDVLHPGGLELTGHLGAVIGLEPSDRLLDVACGRGASAIHLAERFGCHVTGVDLGPENVAAALTLADDHRVSDRTTFRRGDAEKLPFDDSVFDVVIFECSFCTFPNKETAAAEMARVLRPGGRLGLTDVTIDGPVPEDVRGLLAWIACVAGAGTTEDYVATLREAGFARFVIEDQREALLDMTANVRRRLLGVELAVGLVKLELGGLDLSEGKRLTRRVAQLIDQDEIGYVLIAASLN